MGANVPGVSGLTGVAGGLGTGLSVILNGQSPLSSLGFGSSSFGTPTITAISLPSGTVLSPNDSIVISQQDIDQVAFGAVVALDGTVVDISNPEVIAAAVAGANQGFLGSIGGFIGDIGSGIGGFFGDIGSGIGGFFGGCSPTAVVSAPNLGGLLLWLLPLQLLLGMLLLRQRRRRRERD
jgi:hypothetical protein